MTGQGASDLLHLTLANPRAAAARLMALNLPLGTGWTALLLMAVISAGLGFAGVVMSPIEMDPDLQALFGSPMRTALIQVAALTLTGVMADWVGRRFGGRGNLAQALVLVAWAQVPSILLQLMQLAAMVLAPALAPLIGLVSFAVYAVLLSLFITELHGFRSAVVVFFFMIAVSMLVAFFAAVVFATLLGVPAHV